MVLVTFCVNQIMTNFGCYAPRSWWLWVYWFTWASNCYDLWFVLSYDNPDAMMDFIHRSAQFLTLHIFFSLFANVLRYEFLVGGWLTVYQWAVSAFHPCPCQIKERRMWLYIGHPIVMSPLCQAIIPANFYEQLPWPQSLSWLCFNPLLEVAAMSATHCIALLTAFLASFELFLDVVSMTMDQQGQFFVHFGLQTPCLL